MPSDSGLPELSPEQEAAFRELVQLGQEMDIKAPRVTLTSEELDRIADGEPYCFRCGKPASSFPEYESDGDYISRAAYVINEEGTYNPDTNRFACDGCYIALGCPVGPAGTGWVAP